MIDTLIDRLPLGWALKFALLCLLARWRSFITVMIGVLLAAVIGANVPLYTQAVAQVGLLERLQQSPLEDVHSYGRVTFLPNNELTLTEFWQSLNSQVQVEIDTLLRHEISDWVQYNTNGIETSPLQVFHDDNTRIDSTRLRFAYYENWETAIRVVEGVLPTESSDPNIDVEVAIPFQGAVALGVGVGDVLILNEEARESSLPISAKITAIIIENDFTDARWFEPSPLRVEQGNITETNLFATRADVLRIAETFLPETRSRVHWRIVFDYSAVSFNNIDHAIRQLDTFDDSLESILDFSQSSYVYNNDAISIIREYQNEVDRLNAPFSLLLLQIGGLILLFLVVIVALVRRGERREIAMLQSRGSFDRQIILVRGLEALIICVLGALTAPIIARQFLLWVTPHLMGVDSISLEISSQAYLLSALASIFALMVLIMSLRPVLKLPLISAGGSALRADTQLWWQRYYLDIVLILLGIAGLWRLLDENSTLIETNGGETRADPLLLLTPALLFLALGSALLRFFPLIMRGIAHLLSSRSGLGGALAGWQVSRESVHYARITFLLALSVGIGWFATSFQATLTRSQNDQARYQVGADLQISERDLNGGLTQPPPLDDYLALPDVDSATQVLRFDEVGVSLNILQFGTGDVLGVDSETFASTAFWRDDLGDIPLPSSDIVEERSGLLLPSTPTRVEFWARMNVIPDGESNPNTLERSSALPILLLNTMVSAQFENANGENFNITFTLDEAQDFDLAETMQLIINESDDLSEHVNSLSGWVHFSVHIPLDTINFTDSTHVMGMTFTVSPPFGNAGVHELFITEFNFTNDEDEIIDQDWLMNDMWELFTFAQFTPFSNFEIISETLRTTDIGGHRLIWQQTNRNTFLALSLNSIDAPPIPAIVSQSFLDLNNLAVGLSFPLSINQQTMTFEIIDVTQYYPTLYQERPFVIVDLDLLTTRLNQGSANPIHPNETWIKLHNDVSDIAFLQEFQLDNPERGLVAAQTHSEALNKFNTDPLSLGLIGLLFLSFVVILILSIISLFTYAALTAQARKSEFGVLQAMGLSSGRIVYSLAVEQLLVVSISVIIGAVIGIVLSSQVLPALATSTSTQVIAPPFVVQTETEALLQYGGVMLIVLSSVLLFILMLVRQLSLSQALRLGEE